MALEADAGACRIGLWGTFDLEDFGLLLHPRIARHELSRRLPGADIRAYAPYGYLRPTRFDGGEPAEPLVDSVGAGLDVVVATGGDLLRSDAEFAADYGAEGGQFRRWFADGPAGGVPYFHLPEPDPVVLAPRVFPPAVLAKRREYIRLMGWYQPGAIVVQGTRADLGAVDSVVAALADAAAAVVLVELTPYRGDSEFADAVVARLPGALRMPAAVSHEDLVAAISSASAFIGSSDHGRLVAAAYRVPAATLDDPVPRLADVSGEQAAVDEFYDRVAEIARPRSGAGGGHATTRPPAYYAALRRAHEQRGQRLLTERATLADHVADLRRTLDTVSATAMAAQQQAAAEAQGRLTAEAELQALRATRMFRWSQKPRDAYRFLRQLRP